jgi:hypothetical protein
VLLLGLATPQSQKASGDGGCWWIDGLATIVAAVAAVFALVL